MRATRIQLENILCPIDFSEFSARALEHAVAMARRFNGEVTVLHVIPYAAAYGGDLPYIPTPPLIADPALKARAEIEVREFAEPAQDPAVPMSFEIRDGDPWREIRTMEEELPADLVVMGTHGRGGFERLLLGSVTEKVLRKVEASVLTVRSDGGTKCLAPGRISRILCATDVTGASASTITFALSLAAECQASLTFLHVVDNLPPATGVEYPIMVDTEPLRRELIDLARKSLHEAVSDEARVWCDVSERVEAGTPYQRILEVATQEGSDLIVLGSHGRDTVGSMLFGSTSQHVVRAAHCPVLAVRPSRRVKVTATGFEEVVGLRARLG